MRAHILFPRIVFKEFMEHIVDYDRKNTHVSHRWDVSSSSAFEIQMHKQPRLHWTGIEHGRWFTTRNRHTQLDKSVFPVIKVNFPIKKWNTPGAYITIIMLYFKVLYESKNGNSVPTKPQVSKIQKCVLKNKIKKTQDILYWKYIKDITICVILDLIKLKNIKLNKKNKKN